MIVELTNDKQHQPSLIEKVRGPLTIKCFCPSQLHIGRRQSVSDRNGDGAHAFHGSREAKASISIPYIGCLERTRLQFPCDEHRTRCYDSWTGLGGRAIYEDSLVADPLS
jgi:hypothetical protein